MPCVESGLDLPARSVFRPPFQSLDSAVTAQNLRSLHDASQPIVERFAAMHGAAVVTHHQIAYRPMMLPEEARARCMRNQLFDQLVTFIARHSFHVANEIGTDVEYRTAGFRMRADQRMRSRNNRILLV